MIWRTESTTPSKGSGQYDLHARQGRTEIRMLCASSRITPIHTLQLADPKPNAQSQDKMIFSIPIITTYSTDHTNHRSHEGDRLV